MADSKVGKVTHYYDHVGVAVVDLSGDLAVGDEIKVVGHGKEFNQKVDSMQIEHAAVSKAKKGDTVGIKVEQKAKDGDEVFIIKA